MPRCQKFRRGYGQVSLSCFVCLELIINFVDASSGGALCLCGRCSRSTFSMGALDPAICCKFSSGAQTSQSQSREIARTFTASTPSKPASDSLRCACEVRALTRFRQKMLDEADQAKAVLNNEELGNYVKWWVNNAGPQRQNTRVLLSSLVGVGFAGIQSSGTVVSQSR